MSKLSFIKTTAHRSFGSMWTVYTDVDGRRKMIPYHELIDGKFVETKEYKEMKAWGKMP